MANIRTVEHRFLQSRLLLDVLMAAIGMLLAYFLRFHLLDRSGVLPVAGGYDPLHYAGLFAYAAPLAIVSFAWVGLYGLSDPVFNYDIFKRIIRGTLLALSLVLAINFFFRVILLYSRAVYALAPFCVIFFVAVGRLLLRRRIRKLRLQKKIGVTRVLIVGVGQLARELIRRIRQHPETGLEIKGLVAAQPDCVGETIEGLKVLGRTSQIRDLIRDNKVRKVIFAHPQLTTEEIFELMLACEKEMAESRFVPNLLEMRLTDYSFENIDGLPLFGLCTSPLHGLNLVVKTLFDKTVASFALVLGAPLYAALALWLWLDSGRPIFYKQRRLGMDGRAFNMYKFRSMRVDAEENGDRWTAENDPRRTRAGRFMRRWNLDELPQLINVWRGDMSLVGPRPERPEWVEKFREEMPHYMRRHTVKSGITGWAQVHGLRGDTNLKQRLEHDLFYIEHWTLSLDLKILFLTLKAWKNAY